MQGFDVDEACVHKNLGDRAAVAVADQLIDNRASSAAREFAWGSLQRTVATVVPIMPSLKKSMLGRVMLTRLGPRKAQW